MQIQSIKDARLLARLDGLIFPVCWAEHDFSALLNQSGVIAFVGSLTPTGPAGYCLLRQVLDEAEVIRLGVLPEHQREGLGRGLLGEMQAWAGKVGVARVFLEVREGNDAARGLYQRAGFIESGRRQGYYSNPREDACLMELRLGVGSSTQAR